jgi:hypothetical protein
MRCLLHHSSSDDPVYRKMERRRPENITLPPVRSILNQTPFKSSHYEGTNHGRDEWYCAPPKTAPLPSFYHPNGYPIQHRQEEHIQAPTTPKEAFRPRCVYPSPASDQHSDDVEMGEGTTWWESAKTPLFKVDESVFDTTSTATEIQDVATPTKPLATPSIVHYRPNGIPSVRNRRPSTCDPQKRKSKSDPQNDSKIRMVKWDRVTDKGTAPLNVEPRHPTQRSCTLCYLIKKKVPPEPVR